MDRKKITAMTELYAIGSPGKYDRHRAIPGIVLDPGNCTVIRSRDRGVGILEVRATIVPHSQRPEGTFATTGVPVVAYFGKGDDFGDTRRKLMVEWALRVLSVFDSRTALPKLPEWLDFGVYPAREIIAPWQSHHETLMAEGRARDEQQRIKDAERDRQNEAWVRLDKWLGGQYLPTRNYGGHPVVRDWTDLEALLKLAAKTPVRS